MKRILNVISTLEQGGVESVVINYLNHMDSDKVAFDFLVMWGEKKGYHEDYLRSKGCKIFKMENSPKKFFKHGRELRQFFSNHHYDVVHIHAMSALRYRVAKAAKKCGVKTVIYHSHNSSNGSHLFYHKLLKSRLNKWCDYKFACSIVAGEYMYNGAFQVINNAIDIPHFSFHENDRSELKRKFGLEDKIVIGNVGRLTEVKNQQFLLKLAPYLETRIKNYVIFCIGEGEQRGELERYIKENALEEHVILAGTVGTEVYRYYSLFDCLAFPSTFEGLSMVLMEAQANGLPVVASNQLSVEHKVTENFRFLPIDEREENFAAWADAISSLCTKRTDDAAALTEAGFDIDVEAKKLQEFYLKISDKA